MATVAEQMVKTLIEAGVKRIYGIVGETNTIAQTVISSTCAASASNVARDDSHISFESHASPPKSAAPSEVHDCCQGEGVNHDRN